MNIFPTSLPPEVVLRIVSFLDQHDCLQCLQVCRHWHSEMPLYTTDLWKEVVISPACWSTMNSCLIRSLGVHTQKLSISDMDVFSILHRFKKLKCKITSLEIAQVHDDTMTHDQHMEDHARFLSTIKQFDWSLRQLSIIDYSFGLLVTEVLQQFPNLTHLTLLFDHRLHEYLSKPLVVHDTSNPGFRSYAGLVYLHLDAFLNFDCRIVPTLRRCPMLKTLRLSNDGIDAFSMPSNFATIFQLCPHLMHLTWNEDRYPPDMRDSILMHELDAPSPNTTNGDYKGTLQTFLFSGNISDIDRVLPILRASHHELERIELSFWATSVTPELHTLLSRICFPRLKALVVSRLKMVSDDWVSFLAGCPSIEVLDLYLFKEDLAMNTICAIVGSLDQLQYLKIKRSAESWTPSREEAIWSNTIILSRTRLQYLDLDGVLLTDDGLLNLCDISSLKELSLSQTRYSYITLEGLLAFADKLNSSKSCLATLKLSYFTTLDDTVLQRFSRAKSLSFLLLQWCPKVTEAGLKVFLNGGANGVKRKVTVEHCRLISRFRGLG
ncbi:hypothetical protein BJV82DRAFT_716542 [Fennellomyces sp. T-0311]|nr:hypothetical protein BJV82DRAFT_716542 [Fennellomyces sp. T-0311]